MKVEAFVGRGGVCAQGRRWGADYWSGVTGLYRLNWRVGTSIITFFVVLVVTPWLFGSYLIVTTLLYLCDFIISYFSHTNSNTSFSVLML